MARRTMVQSQLFWNDAQYGAGALVYDATLTGTRVDIANNHALSAGGGLYGHQRARIELDHSSIYRNEAVTGGGGIYTTSLAYLDNVSVWENTARYGAAIRATGGSSFVFGNNVGIADNVSPLWIGDGIEATRARFRNSIIERNHADCSPGVSSIGNVVSPDPACLAGGAAGNVLAPAQTTASFIGAGVVLQIAATSPALDAGDDATCEPDDQRFVARPMGAACDAGAYEREI